MIPVATVSNAVIVTVPVIRTLFEAAADAYSSSRGDTDFGGFVEGGGGHRNRGIECHAVNRRRYANLVELEVRAIVDDDIPETGLYIASD